MVALAFKPVLFVLIGATTFLCFIVVVTWALEREALNSGLVDKAARLRAARRRALYGGAALFLLTLILYSFAPRAGP